MSASQRTPLIALPRALLDGPPAAGGGTAAGVIVGVDGGATKTLAGAVDLASGRVAYGRGGPSNLDAVGAAVTAHSIDTAVTAALQGLSASLVDVSTMVLAVSSVDSAQDVETIRAGVRSGIGSSERHVFVVNDVVAAWAAGSLGAPSIVVISGTGSNALGVDGSGACWRAGGWGHIVGDEGSAYWVAVEALRQAIRYRDGRDDDAALADAALEHFGCASIEAVAQRVYGEATVAAMSKADVADFARRVVALGESGLASARAILEAAAAALAELVVAIDRQLHFAPPVQVRLAGSLFEHSEVLRDRFGQQVDAAIGVAAAQLIDRPPVLGALYLAARAAGRDDAASLVAGLRLPPS